MPLNSIPPTTTVANLDAKRDAARGQCYVDVAFWGGVIPGNQVRTPFLQLKGGNKSSCAFYRIILSLLSDLVSKGSNAF